MAKSWEREKEIIVWDMVLDIPYLSRSVVKSIGDYYSSKVIRFECVQPVIAGLSLPVIHEV